MYMFDWEKKAPPPSLRKFVETLSHFYPPHALPRLREELKTVQYILRSPPEGDRIEGDGGGIGEKSYGTSGMREKERERGAFGIWWPPQSIFTAISFYQNGPLATGR